MYAHIHLGTFTNQLHFSDKTQFAYVNGYAVDKNPLCTSSSVFIFKKNFVYKLYTYNQHCDVPNNEVALDLMIVKVFLRVASRAHTYIGKHVCMYTKYEFA